MTSGGREVILVIIYDITFKPDGHVLFRNGVSVNLFLDHLFIFNSSVSNNAVHLYKKERKQIRQIGKLAILPLGKGFILGHPRSPIRLFEDSTFGFIAYDFRPTFCFPKSKLYHGNVAHFLQTFILNNHNHHSDLDFGIDRVGNMYQLERYLEEKLWFKFVKIYSRV
jgi:hypothetical protein